MVGSLLTTSGAFDRSAITRNAWRLYRDSRMLSWGFCQHMFRRFMRESWQQAREQLHALRNPKPAPVEVVLTAAEKAAIDYHNAQIAEYAPRRLYAVTDQIELMIRHHQQQIAMVRMCAKARCEQADTRRAA